MHPLLQRVPRIQLLGVFECAARVGSFTDAARELRMTQSGVSRHISQLEEIIGLTLFHRTANRVRLSTAGESLLGAVQSGFDLIENSLATQQYAGPTFLLAANPGFAQQWLVPHLDRLQRVLGDADLRLRLFDRNGELDDEVFDAAIHLTSTSDCLPESRVLFEEVVFPVAAPAFARAEQLGPDTDPAALLDVMKLHLDGRDRHWMDWADWFAAHALSWSRTSARMYYNNYPLVLNDAIAGRGVALAWKGLVEPLIDSGALVVVGPAVQRAGNAYQLIPGRTSSKDIVERLADWLVQMTACTIAPIPFKPEQPEQTNHKLAK